MLRTAALKGSVLPPAAPLMPANRCLTLLAKGRIQPCDVCMHCRTAYAKGIPGDDVAQRQARTAQCLKCEKTLTKQGKPTVPWDQQPAAAAEPLEQRARRSSLGADAGTRPARFS